MLDRKVIIPAGSVLLLHASSRDAVHSSPRETLISSNKCEAKKENQRAEGNELINVQERLQKYKL